MYVVSCFRRGVCTDTPPAAFSLQSEESSVSVRSALSLFYLDVPIRYRRAALAGHFFHSEWPCLVFMKFLNSTCLFRLAIMFAKPTVDLAADNRVFIGETIQ